MPGARGVTVGTGSGIAETWDGGSISGGSEAIAVEVDGDAIVLVAAGCSTVRLIGGGERRRGRGM